MVVNITYFVHGTTTDNENNISTGWNPGKLSELGIKQSQELGEIIKNKKFDVIFCSNLKRAIDSANLVFPGQEMIRDKRLSECNYGDLNGADENQVIYEDHINKPFPNGESMLDVENRIKNFLDFLRQNYDGQQIATLSHKAPQLALEVLLNNKTWAEAISIDWRKEKAWQPGWKYILN